MRPIVATGNEKGPFGCVDCRRGCGGTGMWKIRECFPSMAGRVAEGVPEISANRMSLGPSGEADATEKVEATVRGSGDAEDSPGSRPRRKLLPARLQMVQIQGEKLAQCCCVRRCGGSTGHENCAPYERTACVGAGRGEWGVRPGCEGPVFPAQNKNCGVMPVRAAASDAENPLRNRDRNSIGERFRKWGCWDP